MRQPGYSGPGDIYSFAIIASEVINRKPAWSIRDRKESMDGILDGQIGKDCFRASLLDKERWHASY